MVPRVVWQVFFEGFVNFCLVLSAAMMPLMRFLIIIVQYEKDILFKYEKKKNLAPDMLKLATLPKIEDFQHFQWTTVLMNNHVWWGSLPCLHTLAIFQCTVILKSLIKAVLHLLPKMSLFCALSQNNQHLFEK